MRERVIIGVVVLCLGVFVLLRGASFTSRNDVLKVGDVKVTATERQTVPPWVGGAVALVGIAVIVAGTRKRA